MGVWKTQSWSRKELEGQPGSHKHLHLSRWCSREHDVLLRERPRASEQLRALTVGPFKGN